jgi:hypothetical protein
MGKILPGSAGGWASIMFALGSIMVISEVLIGVINDKGMADHLFSPGDWSVIGYLGVFLWAGAVIFGISIRFRGSRNKRSRRSIFLRGRTAFVCPICKRRLNASHVNYYERIECPCGEEYEVFEDMPWDETYEQNKV